MREFTEGILARAPFSATTCVFPDIWTGKKRSFFCPFLVSLVNIAQKSGEKMQAHARGPPGVTREAAGTYERPVGFQGVRTIVVEYTVRVLVPFQGVIQPPWRPAQAKGRGNAGQRKGPCCHFLLHLCEPCSHRTGRVSMTAFASGGQVMCGAEGQVHVRTFGELHDVSPKDPGRLLFVSDRVPRLRKGTGGVIRKTARVSGPVRLSPSGRAVIIAAASQRSMLPCDRFLAVAKGEEVSCFFFDMPSDNGRESPEAVLSPLPAGSVAL